MEYENNLIKSMTYLSKYISETYRNEEAIRSDIILGMFEIWKRELNSHIKNRGLTAIIDNVEHEIGIYGINLCLSNEEDFENGYVFGEFESGLNYATGLYNSMTSKEEEIFNHVHDKSMKHLKYTKQYIETEKELMQNLKNSNNGKLSEKELENLLVQDLSLIEEEMSLIKQQYSVDNGYIDILARDKDDKLCIVELKVTDSDSRVVNQSVYYPTQFDESTRMITIAPDYSNKISQSLQSLGYVEMKTYTFDNDQLHIQDYKQ